MTGRMRGDWAAWIDRRLDQIRADGRWRAPRTFDAFGPRGTLAATGQRVVSFASNDYLGLTTHPAVLAAAHDALDRWGAGAGGARLITGFRPVHAELEAELAAWKGADRAVLFPTGFAANLGVLSTLGAAGVRIVSDERNHASIIDGCAPRPRRGPRGARSRSLRRRSGRRGGRAGGHPVQDARCPRRLRPGHPSPIVAVLLGDEARAVAAAEHLLDLGLLVPAIRPPTVAPGTSRLRSPCPPPTPTKR